MIQLTKLDQVSILVNLDTIKYVEQIPDTLLHFTSGESLIVRESLEELKQKVMEAKIAVIKHSQNSKKEEHANNIDN